MAKKKFALNNSYFKNRQADDPETPSEVVSYLMEHGELPFRYDGDNWAYDMICERQKRRGVIHGQYLTPDTTARRMAELATRFTDVRTALDACCGTGQITGALLGRGFEVSAFDIDLEMLAVHKYLYPQVGAVQGSFGDWRGADTHSLIVSNPPYEMDRITVFMDWLACRLEPRGKAVLLVPSGFIDKTRPRKLAQTLSRFCVLHREPMPEPFERTNTRAEILVLELLENYDR